MLSAAHERREEATAWLRVEGRKRRDNKWRLSVSGVLAGEWFQYGMTLSEEALTQLLLGLQTALGAAELVERGEKRLRIEYGARTFEAGVVLLFLVGAYRLRSEKRLKRLIQCLQGAQPTSPGYWKLLELILLLLPKPETPGYSRPRRLTIASRVIRGYCLA